MSSNISRPHGITPQRPIRPYPSPPRPPNHQSGPKQPLHPQPSGPNPQVPQPMPPRPSGPLPSRPPMPPHTPGHRPSRPDWPHGTRPERPTMPSVPRPPHHSVLPVGFPVLTQARIGIVISGRGRINLQRWSIRFSQIIDRIPNNSFVWVFGERHGWSLVYFNGQFGFVDSRLVFLL